MIAKADQNGPSDNAERGAQEPPPKNEPPKLTLTPDTAKEFLKLVESVEDNTKSRRGRKKKAKPSAN